MAIPPTVTSDLQTVIKTASQTAFPNEAWGFIVRIPSGGLKVYQGTNASDNPTKYFRSTPQDWIAAEKMGTIEMVWHSHPNAKPAPTVADKKNAESNQLPMLIYATPADLWDSYQPCGFEVPLIGRPFVPGVLDCYTLIRDFYRMELKIEIPDFDRPEDWWKTIKDSKGNIIRKPLNLYMDNFPAAGFARVETLQKHDVVLMRLVAGLVSHGGIYLGDGAMLHQPPGRQSVKIPYNPGNGSHYARATECFVRHKSIATVAQANLPGPVKLAVPKH